ncbi:MAG: cobalt-precorrin-5B (C(1))-methyltransferase [Pseudomonadota bacterium]
MAEETAEARRPLKSGYTTGACATATSLAAARLLLTSRSDLRCLIRLPRGESVEFELSECQILPNGTARAATVKDAGDDPDATHGATVFSVVELSAESGIRFHAAEGVGTVTRDGLEIAVGEPAINPVPRVMMTEHLQTLATKLEYAGGFEVYIGIENGEKIALDTMNGRLGIVGGLSILGTTGIVRPFSCAAYIASIHQSIDVAHANDIVHVAASTGSTSEQAIRERLNLVDMACVEMGDFAGAVLKHLRRVPMQKLSICGGFGKMTKLASGHSSLHSKDASIDFSLLTHLAEEAGASQSDLDQIRTSNTSIEALKHCQTVGIPLADKVCELAREQARKMCQHKVEVDVYAVDRKGVFVGESMGP